MRCFPLRLDPASGKHVLDCPLRGQRLIQDPYFNKGSAFTLEERRRFGLEGLLPSHVSTIDQQVQRVYRNITRKTDPVEKFVGLAALQERNEVLFYRLLLEHIEEFVPIIYTPTVGQACEQFSHLFRRPRGVWITPRDRGRIDQMLANVPFEDVRLIVVTDNERILGLGDQGAGGMGIPVGKLALYSLAAGIHPAQTLPISLDVGTDNSALRDDELYLGWREPRMRGQSYDELVDEFVTAVKRRFPRALLQWEDFKKQNAFNLLDRYRTSIPSFNDDIQGTAAVAVAGVLAAGRVTGTPIDRERIVILGAGAAGVGIGRLLRDAMRAAGATPDQVRRAIALIDTAGLLVEGREIKEAAKREFAWPADLARRHGFTAGAPGHLDDVVAAVRPTVLIGTSGQPGVFTEPIVRTMARYVDRPAIFPFSNPTSKSEAVPRELMEWTQGRALVATGSPFAPVKLEDAARTIRIGQGNNVYIFPGVGLGALVSKARLVTDSMFVVAARTLADCVSADDLESGSLYPPLANIRSVSARIAAAVARTAREEGVGDPIPDDAIPAAVEAAMWTPDYPELNPV